MSCTPQYPFRPKFVPSEVKCIAPTFVEHRSRLFDGGTFFRSIKQGQDQNNITLELIKTGAVSPFTFTLNIRFNGNLIETFVQSQTETTNPTPPPPTNCTGGISGLRAQVNNLITGSTLITMPVRDTDFFDSGGMDEAGNCLSPFVEQNMTGGDGEPAADNIPFINSIRTGPERTIIIIQTTENSVGFPVTPPTDRRVRQFNGTEFITFNNTVSGSCPIDGSPV